MSALPLLDSYATLSTKRLHELREAIDLVIHRREDGLAPRPSNLCYFNLNGDKACQIHSFSSYAVTETGRVYSYISGRYILAHQDPKTGAFVTLRSPLSKRGKRNILIHRLVALYFLDKTDDCKFIQHMDGNRLNNHVSNLRWMNPPKVQYHGVRADSKTGYRGVTKLPNGKYAATIRGKYIRCCDTAEEAARIYNQRAKELGFVFLNTIPEIS